MSLTACDDLRIGERLLQVVFGAEQEVQRHHAGLRRERRGVRRRADAELDVAGLHQLQHLRLLPELRAGILVDDHRALAQLLELVGEDVAGDAVPGVARLVVGESVVPGFLAPSCRLTTLAADQADQGERSPTPRA